MSSALDFLRSLPDEQAALYAAFINRSAQLRMDIALDSGARVRALQALVADTLRRLQALRDQANDAARRIAEKVAKIEASGDAESTEAAEKRILWASDHGLDLDAMCQQLVADGDRPGFAALRKVLPWLIRAKHNPTSGQPGTAVDMTRALTEARSKIATYERQLMTDNERAMLEEQRECTISMPLMQDNFNKLEKAFQRGDNPAAVQQGIKVEALWHWQGLPNDGRPKGSMHLQPEKAGPQPQDMRVPQRGDTSPYNPADAPYLVSGKTGQAVTNPWTPRDPQMIDSREWQTRDTVMAEWERKSNG